FLSSSIGHHISSRHWSSGVCSSIFLVDFVAVRDHLRPKELCSLSPLKTDPEILFRRNVPHGNPAAGVILFPDGVADRFIGHIGRSEEHTSELQSRENLGCRLLLDKK